MNSIPETKNSKKRNTCELSSTSSSETMGVSTKVRCSTTKKEMSANLTLYHVPKLCSSICAQLIIELDQQRRQRGETTTGIQIQQLNWPMDLKTKEYLKLNPHGEVPVLRVEFQSTIHSDEEGKDTIEDSQVVMSETGAILQYILNAFDHTNELHPSNVCSSLEDSKMLSNYYHLFFYGLVTVMPLAKEMYLSYLALCNADRVHNPSEAQIAERCKAQESLSRTKKLFRNIAAPKLEAQLFRQGTQYFLGSSLSVVDLVMTKPLRNAFQSGALDEQTFPLLFSYFNLVSSRKSYAATYE